LEDQDAGGDDCRYCSSLLRVPRCHVVSDAMLSCIGLISNLSVKMLPCAVFTNELLCCNFV
jgi:hypothetical protein